MPAPALDLSEPSNAEDLLPCSDASPGLSSTQTPAAEIPLDEEVSGRADLASQTGLEARALRATLWTVLDYGSGQALRVVNSYILTRLLFPAAFGQMTLVTTLIVGITLLSDIGLAPSVIQSKRGDEPTFLNTAFTLQAVRGLGMWLVALLLTWPASIFYHLPSLRYVIPVLALSTLLNGLNSTNLLTLSRHMGVRRMFFFDFSSQLVALVVTIAWAYRWPSIWALVAGNLATNLYRLLLSHNRRAVPGPRSRFAWDPASIREIFHFGKWIFLATALFFFASQSDRLILGRKVSLATLGVYGIAYSLSDIPRSIMDAFSYKVGYPFVARIIHLPMADFREQFLRYRRYALLIGGFLLAAMVVWGNLIILKLYKPAYWEGAWMIPVLAAGLWHTLLYMTTRPVLFSLGKSKYNAVGNACFCVAMLLGIPIAFHFYNLPGAVIAVAAGDLPLYAVTQFGAVREGVRPLRQDAQMTLVFLLFLSLDFAARHWL